MASEGYRRIEVRPTAGALGAQIHGVDLNGLDAEDFDEIHRAFLAHHVIFFRDQALTPESHKAFGRRFGTLNVHPQYVPLDGHPEILPVVKEADDADNIGAVWHSDVTFLERPAAASILYALEVPAGGGDTLFANQALAYEALSPGMRAFLSGLRALHSDFALSDRGEAEKRNATRSTKLLAGGGPPIESVHPVVRTHPETGRKCLFVNGAFTQRFEDMSVAESEALLEFLYVHAVRPEFTCRFRWERGSLAMWDNRCVQHYALNDYRGERRHMHRVTVDGDKPF